ncbi:MAG: preprotein translocase subunit YajC [Clostridiales bacterium]|nr:preprotein translocase subunit YajC [Clostridiales bacterium]
MLSNLLAQADITSTVMIVVLLVAIVGLFIWSSYSNKKRQKQAQDMVNGIKIGDKVKTIGGVCGYVAEIDDSENTFVLRTGMEGKDSFVKFDKGAIYQTAPANPKQDKKEEVKEEKKEEKVEEKPAE